MEQDRKHIHGEPGILRKKHENEEELLVFGYSCKLFRDDEKALYIDQGKHLIPWMGDESLKIDRYDVRGALSDLSMYESKSGIHGNSDWNSMSSEERRIEQLCDEERYRALYHNEEEEALYQEEELKRLHQALGSDKEYGQVEYKYGDDNVQEETKEKETAVDEHDEPFIPPPNLDIPPNMITPETKKLNAIIEKTAMFINQQGPQMEILLKMKQASNRQFDFLSFSSPLHPYYRHLLMVIKSGRYRPVSLIEETSTQDEQKAYDDHYLHPSLAPAPTVLEAAPSIPSINYKPSSDCLYSMLVNKIKGKLNVEDKGVTLTNTKEATTAEKDKEPAELSSGYEEVPKPSVEICAGPVRYTYNSTSQNSSSEELSARSSPVQLLSKAAKRRRRKRLQNEVASNGDSGYHDTETGSVETATSRDDSNSEYSENTPTYHNSSYSSSTDTHSYTEEPPSELKVIIDKMAVYVAKNGTSFESIVRSKGGGDPRFAFLDVNNEYHTYYKQKVEFYERVQKPPPPPPVPAVTVQSEEVGSTQYGGDMETETTDSDKNLSQFSESSHNCSLIVDSPQSSDKSSLPSPSDTSSSQSKPVPVCFSIKKPKETEKLELCRALPVEESSEDEEGEDETKSQDSCEKHEVVNNKKEDKKSKEISVKKWEERVKDKLALAAKEKLSVKEREKQLQSERKKKAAAFLHQLQKETSGTASATGSQSDDPSSIETSGVLTAESVPSYVTSPASESSSEKEERNNNVRINTPLIPSPIQISDEDNKGRGESSHAAETLARILEAIPKEKRNHVSKHSHHRSLQRSRSHSHTKYDAEQRHRHHRHHRHHHDDRERSETHHRSSHKRKHKHKSSGKSYKRKRRNDSSSSE